MVVICNRPSIVLVLVLLFVRLWWQPTSAASTAAETNTAGTTVKPAESTAAAITAVTTETVKPSEPTGWQPLHCDL